MWCGQKWPQPNLKYCPSICSGGLRKIVQKTWKRQSMHPDLNQGPLKHKIGTITAQVLHSDPTDVRLC